MPAPSSKAAWRLAQAVALAWLFGFAYPHALGKERIADIAQYWAGGAMVAHGTPEALYPEPLPGAERNAGFGDAARPRPAYRALAREAGVVGYNRFVYPPPTALLFTPLGLLDYPRAKAAWLFLMVLSVYGTASCAARLHARLAGERTRASALVLVAVAVSPLALSTLRSGNVTPLVAWALGAALLALLEDRPARAGSALALAGVFKGTGAVLLPLALLRRRTRALVWLAFLTSLVLGASWLALGPGPFRVFVEEILPTLARTADSSGNQSLHGFVARALGTRGIPAEIGGALRLAGLVGGAALGLLIWRGRERLARSEQDQCATVAALLAVVLLTSPLAWSHYHLLAAPLWGWALTMAQVSRVRLALAAAAVGLAYVPLCTLDPRPLPLPEPLRSHMTLAALALLALGTLGIVRPAGRLAP